MEEEGKPVDGIGLTVAGKNKRRYEQPLLKRFGSVKMLTTGGGDRPAEGPGPSSAPADCQSPGAAPHKSCI